MLMPMLTFLPLHYFNAIVVKITETGQPGFRQLNLKSPIRAKALP
jgi:hypothetical protein